MNKKFLFSAALVSILGFGSCVDNNESPSVTNIREAKAEQLKALAAVENANAQAALIAANAEAKAKEAQAAYFEAQAAFEQARAEYQAALTEQAKADAEAAMARAEVEKQKAANELQTLAGELEIALLNQKTQLIYAQKQYENAIKNSEADKAAELQELLNQYNQYSQSLLNAREMLAYDKIQLAQLKAGLIDAAESNQKTIAQNNKEIADLQAEIPGWQAYIDTYKKYSNTAEAKAAYQEAQLALVDLQKACDAASTTSDKANQALSKAYGILNSSAYKIAIEYFTNWNYNVINNISISQNWEYENGRPSAEYSNYCAVVYDENWNPSYIPLFTGAEEEYKNIEYTLNETQRPSVSGYYQYNSFYNLIDGGFDAYFKAVEASIKANQEKNLADAQAAYKTASDNVTAATTDLANKTKAYNDAKAIVDKAGDDATAAQIQAMYDAENAKTNAEYALSDAETAQDNALTNQNVSEDNLASVKEQLAENKAKYEILAANAEKNTENVKAYNDASLAYANAFIEYRKANVAYDEKSNESWALWQILNDSQNVDSTIASYQANIDYANDRIADLEKENKKLENVDPNQEQAVTNLEARIADQEYQIETLEKQVEIAKGKLDAAMEEETPAE